MAVQSGANKQARNQVVLMQALYIITFAYALLCDWNFELYVTWKLARDATSRKEELSLAKPTCTVVWLMVSAHMLCCSVPAGYSLTCSRLSDAVIASSCRVMLLCCICMPAMRLTASAYFLCRAGSGMPSAMFARAVSNSSHLTM